MVNHMFYYIIVYFMPYLYIIQPDFCIRECTENNERLTVIFPNFEQFLGNLFFMSQRVTLCRDVAISVSLLFTVILLSLSLVLEILQSCWSIQKLFKTN